jgi:aspartate 1-decarboxylase
VVIVLSYVTLQEEEARRHQPRLVYVDEANRIVERAGAH